MSGDASMDMEKLASIFEAVKVMPLRETDIIVFRCGHRVSAEQSRQVRDALSSALGMHLHRIIVLDDGADVEILRREAAAP